MNEKYTHTHISFKSMFILKTPYIKTLGEVSITKLLAMSAGLKNYYIREIGTLVFCLLLSPI